jgi:hypothetical protein
MSNVLWTDLEYFRRLLESAVKTCASDEQPLLTPVWEVVADRLLVGSTHARELCRAFNVDPDTPAPRKEIRDDEGYCLSCGANVKDLM